MVSTLPASVVESAQLETQPPVERVPDAAERTSRFRRFLQWFWGGKRWREVREAQRAVSPVVLEQRRRAYAALTLGRRALESTGGFEHGPLDAIACDLFRQSIYWALRARRVATASLDGVTTLKDLWPTLDATELAAFAGDPSRTTALSRALLDDDFRAYAELDIDEQIRLGQHLSGFAEQLLEDDDALTLKLERLWLARAWRIALPIAFVASIVVATLLALRSSEDARDIARGKAWVASSKYPEGGCTSPAQRCTESPDYFFSTGEEENPWIEFDLGPKSTVSAVLVQNRVECPERAVPLVIEVSNDHGTWKEVARREEEFRSVKLSFAKVEARWVRVRVARKSFLHLQRIKMFG